MTVLPILTAATPIINRILDLIPNAADKAKAQQELFAEIVKIEAEQKMAQVDLNKQEAAHASIFVAGWRPFIGWVGGVSLAWTFLLHPIVTWIATVAGYEGTFPALDTDPLLTLVMAMLGVGAMRSFDKLQGTDTKRISFTGTKQNNKPTYNE